MQNVPVSSASDAVFRAFEIGYISLRFETELKRYSHVNNTAQLEEMKSRSYFIFDPTLQSVLNKYHEVGIGDLIYVFQSPGQIIQVDCEEAAQSLRLSAKGSIILNNFEHIAGKGKFLFPENGYIKSSLWSRKGEILVSTPVNECLQVESENEIIEEDEIVETPSNDNQSVVDSTFRYDTTVGTNDIPCSVFQKQFSAMLKFKLELDNDGIITDNPFSCYMGNLIVDYGDGNIDSLGQGCSWFFDHTYSETGAFQVTFTFEYFDENIEQIIIVEEQIPVLVESACILTDAGKSFWAYDLPNDRAMNYEIWYNVNLFGSTAGSRTTGYKQLGNAVKVKGEVFVDINATFLNSTCTESNQKDESDDCNNCKSKKASVTDLFNKRDIGNGSVFSNHEFNDNGANLVRELILDPCP